MLIYCSVRQQISALFTNKVHKLIITQIKNRTLMKQLFIARFTQTYLSSVYFKFEDA